MILHLLLSGKHSSSFTFLLGIIKFERQLLSKKVYCRNSRRDKDPGKKEEKASYSTEYTEFYGWMGRGGDRGS